MRSTAGIMMLVVATILMLESCICNPVMMGLILILEGIGLILVYSIWGPRLQRIWSKIVAADKNIRR